MASNSALRDHIEDVLSTLSPREAEILKLRRGLVDKRARTPEEVGRIFGVPEERVRRIERKATRKLRRPRYKNLKDFLE